MGNNSFTDVVTNITVGNVSILPLSIFMVIGSVCGIFSNLLIFIVFNNIPNTVGNCHFLVKQLALSDISSCLGFIMCRLPAIICEFRSQLFNVSRLQCSILTSLSLVGMTATPFITLLIAIDRCYALFRPKSYLINTNPWAKILTALLWSAIICLVASMVIMSDIDETVPVCIPPLAFTKPIRLWWNAISMSANTGVLVIYFISLMCAKIRYRNYHHEDSGNFVSRRNEQVIRSLTVIIAIHSITWFTTHIVLTGLIAFNLEKNFAVMGLRFAGILCIFNIVADLCIYYCMSQEFRDSLKQLKLSRCLHLQPLITSN